MTSALVILGGYLLGWMPFGYWVVLLIKGEAYRLGLHSAESATWVSIPSSSTTPWWTSSRPAR